jgi:hypothetical protein
MPNESEFNEWLKTCPTEHTEYFYHESWIQISFLVQLEEDEEEVSDG